VGCGLTVEPDGLLIVGDPDSELFRSLQTGIKTRSAAVIQIYTRIVEGTLRHGMRDRARGKNECHVGTIGRSEIRRGERQTWASLNSDAAILTLSIDKKNGEEESSRQRMGELHGRGEGRLLQTMGETGGRTMSY